MSDRDVRYSSDANCNGDDSTIDKHDSIVSVSSSYLKKATFVRRKNEKQIEMY